MIDKRIPAGDSSSHTILHEQNTITQNHPVVVAVHNIYRGKSIAYYCWLSNEIRKSTSTVVKSERTMCFLRIYDCSMFAFMNVFTIWG